MGELCAALLAHTPRAACWAFEGAATGSPTIRALAHEEMDTLARGHPPRAWQPPSVAARAATAERAAAERLQPSDHERANHQSAEHEPAVVGTIRSENAPSSGLPHAHLGDSGGGGGPRGLADVLSDEELAMLLASGPVVSNDPLNEVRARPV
jgi:hypothetical protein